MGGKQLDLALQKVMFSISLYTFYDILTSFIRIILPFFAPSPLLSSFFYGSARSSLCRFKGSFLGDSLKLCVLEEDMMISVSCWSQVDGKRSKSSFLTGLLAVVSFREGSTGKASRLGQSLVSNLRLKNLFPPLTRSCWFSLSSKNPKKEVFSGEKCSLSESAFCLRTGSVNSCGKQMRCWEVRREEASFLGKKSTGSLFLLILMRFILARGSLRRWFSRRRTGRSGMVQDSENCLRGSLGWRSISSLQFMIYNYFGVAGREYRAPLFGRRGLGQEGGSRNRSKFGVVRRSANKNNGGNQLRGGNSGDALFFEPPSAAASPHSPKNRNRLLLSSHTVLTHLRLPTSALIPRPLPPIKRVNSTSPHSDKTDHCQPNQSLYIFRTIQFYILIVCSMPVPTPRALSLILAQEQTASDRIVLEVTQAKMGRDSIVKLEVSDGDSRAKAYLDASGGTINSERVEKLLKVGSKNLVVVKEHAVHNFHGTACLEIINFDNIDSSSSEDVKIEAEDTAREKDVPQVAQQPAIEIKPKREDCTKIEAELRRNTEEPGPARPREQQNSPEPRMDNEQQQYLEEITPEQLSLSDKLTDLYPDFQGEWEIIVRLLDKSYREFTSRSGKEIQLLTMQLMDRTGTKIETVMFGEDGTELFSRLIVGEVYRMGKGQIKEHAYAHTLAQGYSNLSIVFGRNSHIVRVRDVRAIPKNAKQEVRIRDLATYMDEEKPLDIVGVLIEIQEEKSTTKEDGRVFYRRNLVVGDPDSRKSVEVLIWGRKFPITPEILNKTVHLRNFKLHSYKQSVSLSSSHKSSLHILNDHPFNTINTRLSYTSISNSQKISNVHEDKPPHTSILQLEQELLYHHDSNETISSELEAWISYVNFKNRWFYSACNNPKCKKSAEPHARCLHCGSANAELVKKFNLQVEFSDFTGSLWICAFDEMVGELFKGWKAEEMSGLTDQQRKEEAEKRLFQKQYLLKISSKKDSQGYVRHGVIGKPMVMDIDETTIRNVNRIKKALY